MKHLKYIGVGLIFLLLFLGFMTLLFWLPAYVKGTALLVFFGIGGAWLIGREVMGDESVYYEDMDDI